MPGVHAIGHLSLILRSSLALLLNAKTLIGEIRQNGEESTKPWGGGIGAGY